MVFLIGITTLHAQQKTSLSLKDAVTMALEKSDAVGLATTKAATKSYELQSIKNNRYPDVKLAIDKCRCQPQNKIEFKQHRTSSV